METSTQFNQPFDKAQPVPFDKAQDRLSFVEGDRLTPAQQKRIKREAAEIIYAGQEAFFQETGLQADEPRNYWAVVAYAMKGLK